MDLSSTSSLPLTEPTPTPPREDENEGEDEDDSMLHAQVEQLRRLSESDGRELAHADAKSGDMLHLTWCGLWLRPALVERT